MAANPFDRHPPLRWNRRSERERIAIEEMLAKLDRCGANEEQISWFDRWWEQHVTNGNEEFIYHPYDFTGGVLTMQTDRENSPTGILQVYRVAQRDGSTDLWTHPYQPTG